MDKGDTRPGHLPWSSLIWLRVIKDENPSIIKLNSEPVPVGYVFQHDARHLLLFGGDAPLADHSPRETAVGKMAEQVALKIPPERFAYREAWLGGRDEARWKYLFSVDLYEEERDKIDFEHLTPERNALRYVSVVEFAWDLHEGVILERHRMLLSLAGLIHDKQIAA